MSAPFGAPSYADLVQQVAALQDQVAQPLTLDDLPLTDLRSALIDNGPPLDLSVLALAQTVGTGLLTDASTTKAKLATDALNTFLKLLVAGDRKVAFGSSTLTFTASATSAAVTVPHGLGVAPAAVLAQPLGGAAFCFIQLNSTDATNLVFQGHDTDAAVRTGTNGFYWLAIG